MFKRLWNKYWPWVEIRHLRRQLSEARVAFTAIQAALSTYRRQTFDYGDVAQPVRKPVC